MRVKGTMRLLVASAMKLRTGGGIRTVLHSTMTVCAPSIEGKQFARAMGLARMIAFRVALLAKSGPGDGQQFFVDGSVWFMTTQAVVACWSVFKQIWTPLFCVAGIAGFVNCRFLQQLLIGCSVGVMAACAVQFAFPNRHVRGAPQLSLAILVALRTGFGFGRLDQLETR